MKTLVPGRWLKTLWFIICTTTAWWGQVGYAKIMTEIVKVPIHLVDDYGKAIDQEIVVTVLVDDATPTPRPVAIINHGRAANAQERADYGRSTQITNARWFARMGFIVATPTRIGYGISGGPDIEDSGECSNKNYPPGYRAAAEQTLSVINFLRTRQDADPNRILVLGQSYGGATAIAVAALRPPGVLASINFAGGGGGNPKTMAQNPCGTARLEKLFADYGTTAQMPTLWVYTENDQWMGPKFPKEWFAAYRAKGGKGQFVQFPPNGTDGHGLFSQAPDVWRPTVLQFLRENGFPELTDLK